MTALALAYMENDASDIQGLHGGQVRVQEFLKLPAVQVMTTCEANLMWGMLFFIVYMTAHYCESIKLYLELAKSTINRM